MDRIGMIGPGRMGLAMIKHLVGAGFSVTASDIDAGQLAKAEAAGATAAGSVAEVGAATDYAIVAVGFDAETIAVTVGENGWSPRWVGARASRSARRLRRRPCA